MGFASGCVSFMRRFKPERGQHQDQRNSKERGENGLPVEMRRIQLPSNGASAGDRPTRGIMVANMRLVREAGSNRLPAPAGHRSGTDTDRLNKAQRQQPRHRGPTACPDSLRQNRQPQQQDGFTAKTIRERPPAIAQKQNRRGTNSNWR